MIEKLAIGTAQFGFDYGIANQTGKILFDEARAIISLAKETGINTLDTATAYGVSEKVLGDIGIDSWKVVTKLPPVPPDCTDMMDWVQKAVMESLERLKIEKLYALLLHRPLQLLDREGFNLFESLSKIKKGGFVEKIGFSIYSPQEIDVLWENFQPDIIQSPFNIFDQRLQISGWLDKLYSTGVEIHARSVFLQGLLLFNCDTRPGKFKPWDNLWKDWGGWLKRENLSPLQTALGFVLSNEKIHRVVVGMDSIGQLNEILSAAKKIPSVFPKHLATMDENLLNPSLWSRL